MWGYYEENLAQAQVDAAGQPAYIQRLLAAYMTLGTEGHRWTMPHYLSELYGLTVNPSSYTLWGARYFNRRGDVDNDGAWNIEEWVNVVEANGGRAHTGVLDEAVAAAMNPATDGSVGGGELDEDEFEHDGVVYTVGSAGHIALVEEATGANDPDLTKTSVTFHSVGDGTTNMSFTAYVLDPPGYEDVPLTDWVLTVALGREIRVELDGDDADKKWFKTWGASNTLINGSPLTTEVFRLGNANQQVKALKRGYKSVSVSESDRIDLSVRGVGELAGEVYSEPDPNYGTKYFVPEGTHLRVRVDKVHSDEDFVCGIGNMSVKEADWANLLVVTSMKGTGLFNPEGLGRINPGACCYARGGSSDLCNLSLKRYTHSFTGEG
ncbi:MAG: hypothetical protein GY851_20890, partial [bacterium]|nr:hypothetical protein [bacterium]